MIIIPLVYYLISGTDLNIPVILDAQVLCHIRARENAPRIASFLDHMTYT